MVNAENLLDHHHAAFRLPSRIGAVSAQFVAIRGR